MKHGESRGGKNGGPTRLYNVWRGIINRTSYPKNIHYKDYGGRGITVCEEWRDSTTFINWARSHGYRDNLIIDREDNNKGYYLANCRFVTDSESSINRRKRSDHGIYRYHNGYQVQIKRNNKDYYGGRTKDLNEAIQMRDKLVKELDDIRLQTTRTTVSGTTI